MGCAKVGEIGQIRGYGGIGFGFWFWFWFLVVLVLRLSFTGLTSLSCLCAWEMLRVILFCVLLYGGKVMEDDEGEMMELTY
jgi:hypothetical protein